MVDVVHQQAFGDLDVDALVGLAGFEDRAALVEEAVVAQLARGHVDRDPQARLIAGAPRHDLAQRLAHHVFPDRHDQPGLFQHGYELGGRDRSAYGAMPSQQGLGADQAIADRAEFGLIKQFELMLGQSVAQIVLKLQAA